MGEDNGQRTSGARVMDGRGRDGQHRSDSSAGTAGDNGQRRRMSEGSEVGQESGHDIQNEVRPSARDADVSTEDRDGDLDDSSY